MTPSSRNAIFDIRLDIKALNHGAAFGCRNEESVGNRGEVGVLSLFLAICAIYMAGKGIIPSDNFVKYLSGIKPLFF